MESEKYLKLNFSRCD